MEIIFPSRESKDPYRQVILFPALVDGKNVTCLVSREVLEDHFGADWSSSPENVFRNNRSYFESEAGRLILDGKYEQNGEIAILNADIR